MKDFAQRHRIHVVATGGTLEKVYQEPTGRVANTESKVQRYLKRLRLPNAEVDVFSLMNIDSLEMTDADRQRILECVATRLNPGEPVLITHGTDTMVETGLFLKRGLGELAAPVILTGAMTPLGFEESDGLQNLTESVFAARILEPGVYIVIHNQVFPIDRVRKDRVNARFVFTD
jgi:L-asparaginase